jgi:hypothetical protein
MPVAPVAFAPAEQAPPLPSQSLAYAPPLVGPPAGPQVIDHRPPPPLPPAFSPAPLEVQPPHAPPHSVNVFAIASLVLSLVAVPIAGSILAIVFGVVARRQIRETPGGPGGERMASWGIALGCLGIVAAIIVALVLAFGGGRSNALTPGARSSVNAALSSASLPLDTANATFTKTLTADEGGSVSQIAQAVTPYVTALTSFDYKLRQISWTQAEQLQSERLDQQVRSIISYASTISSATAATSTTWLTHLRVLGATAQSTDDGLRSMVGMTMASDFP